MNLSRTLIATAALLMTWLPAGAQPQPQQPQRFSMKALLIKEEQNGDNTKRIVAEDIWIIAATSSQIRFSRDQELFDTEDANLKDYAGLFLYEPKEYAEATALYRARKFSEARAKFAEIKKRYQPVAKLPENPAALAGFYEMECMRRSGDIAALVAAKAGYISTAIAASESRMRQIDLYTLWEAAHNKEWKRVDILARERLEAKMTADQRAQVGYLHGLALEELDRKGEALNEYNVAMTSDAGSSHELARKAALRVLAILNADPEVKLAAKLWGTPDEKKGTSGHIRLQEAGAVAALFEKLLGAGELLPGEFKPLLRYKPEIAAPEAPADGSGAAAPAKEG